MGNQNYYINIIVINYRNSTKKKDFLSLFEVSNVFLIGILYLTKNCDPKVTF